MSVLLQPQPKIAVYILQRLCLVDLFLRVSRHSAVYHRFHCVGTGPIRFPDWRTCWWVTLPIMSTRWCCWCTEWSKPTTVPAFVVPTKRKQAHLVITISANWGDGSVTVSVDMVHIVSISLNCCSRPCHSKNTQNTPCLILWVLVKLEMNGD